MPRRPPRKPRDAPKPAADSPRPNPDPPPRRRGVTLAAVLLLLLHYAVAAASMLRENATVDEVNHLPAGVSYWQTGSFRLYHHNPPLVKLAAALPVVLAGGTMRAAYALPMWQGESPPPAMFGAVFLYQNIERYFELFQVGRLVMPLFSVVGGWVLFLWSRRLFGDRGGLLSLALWCLCPNILAHARLITSDVAAASLALIASFAFDRFLRDQTWKRAALAGLALGLAELVKFSMLLLYPIGPVVAVLTLLARRELRPRGRGWLRFGGQNLTIVLLSVVVIDAGYLFEGVGRPLGSFRFASRSFLTRPGVTPSQGENPLLNLFWQHQVNRFRGTWLEKLPAPLPEHYLLGFDEQKIEADGIPQVWIDPTTTDPDAVQGYTVYLNGDLRQHGWRSYYALAMLYKMPEGTLFLLVVASIIAVSRRDDRKNWLAESGIWVVPLVFFVAMTFFTDINLGLRYVLPIFPFLFLFAGRLGRWADEVGPRWRRWAWGLILVSLGATTVATAWIHPHYLAFFNAASGGPDRTPPRLIDSNLDWGQDLVGLREWVRNHPESQPIGLAYFGQIPPTVFAMRGDGFAWFLPAARPGSLLPMSSSPRLTGPAKRVEPGVYAVSASIVQGLKWRVYDPSEAVPGATWNAQEDAFGYFRHATPFDRMGHSILLYRLSREDADRLESARVSP